MLNPYIALYATYSVRLDVVQTGIVVALWNLGMISTQIPFGRMTDKLGGEPMLFMHFILSTVSWVAYAFSNSFLTATVTMMIFGIIGAMDMPARRTIMLEHATGDSGKATIIGVIDSITTGVGIVAPLIGAIGWAEIGYSAPFMIGAFVNVFACLPMLVLLRRKRWTTV
jgi:MFS family permease